MRTILALLLLFPAVMLGGFEQTDVSARAKALGGSYVGLSDDVWAIFFNVGGLATATRQEVSFLYTPEQFELHELSYAAVALALPTKFGTLGLAAKGYGFKLYREFSGTISYAHSISNVGLGINFNYYAMTIKNYGSAGTVGVDIGVLVRLLDQVRWGISAKNINSPTIGTSCEPLPRKFSSGIAYIPQDDISITFDYQKELGFDPSPRFGFEYWIIHALALRGGMCDVPSEYAGGVGVRFSLFQVDYAFSSHQQLGWTHQASITIRWGE
jgi:hypothetical protein